MKHYLITLLLLATILLAGGVVYASDTSDAQYGGIILITNDGTLASGVSTNCSLNTQALIDLYHINESCNNTAITTNAGADTAYMPSVNTSYPWCIWVPSISANSYLNYRLYTGGDPMDGKIRYFPGATGMTVADNATLELGDNFTIEIPEVYIDTTQVGANITNKTDAFRVYIESAGKLTASMLYASTTFPTVDNVTGGTDSGSSHTVNYPSDIDAGDLLLILFENTETGGDATNTFPDGWTSLFSKQGSDGSYYVTAGAWYKVADGTETGTFEVTTSSSCVSAHTSYCISGYSGVPECGTATSHANSSTPDPPSLTPSWGAQNTLWVAMGVHEGGGVSAYPASYGDGRDDDAGYAGMGSARRELNAASENPGIFTISVAGVVVANTIAIAPDDISVSATSISSGEYKLEVYANAANLTLELDDVIEDTVALGGASVDDNGNAWTFCEAGATPYTSNISISIDGTPAAFWEWEYAETFTDSVNGIVATPTFRTDSSDADVTAELYTFSPITEAIATDWTLTVDNPMVEDTELPAEPSRLTAPRDTTDLFLAPFFEVLVDKGTYSRDMFWYPIAILIICGAGMLIAWATKSIFTQYVIQVVIFFILSFTLIPWWCAIVFIFYGLGISLASKQFGTV